MLSIFSLEDERDRRGEKPLSKEVSPSVITTFGKDKEGYTTLHYAALSCDSAAFQLLLSKVSADNLNQALVAKIPFGQTLLHLVCQKLDSTACQALLAKASNEVVSQALLSKDLNGRTPLHWVMEKLDSATLYVLLTKVTPEIIRKSLLIRNDVSHSRAWIEAQISATTTPAALEPWIALLVKLSGVKGIGGAERPLIELRALLDTIKRLADSSYLNPIVDHIVNHLLFFMPYLGVKTVPSSFVEIEFFTLADGRWDSPAEGGFLERIYESGLASWDDFYKLKKYSDAHLDNKSLHSLLTLMARYNTLKLSSFKSSIHTIHKELLEGHLFIKTFSGGLAKEWSDFLQRLKTPGERISLRIEAQKQPILISAKQHTPLFKLGPAEPIGVGVALLAAPVVETDTLDACLIQTSKESLLGVVISRNTPQARKLARQYQQDIYHQLERTVPIILYDAQRNIIIEDLDLLETVMKKEALLAEKEQLLTTKSTTGSSPFYAFFSGEGPYEGKIYPGDVLRRLHTIDARLSEITIQLNPRETLVETPTTLLGVI